jgi:WD40 repeat protein/serine/threonine protein kinase
MKSTTAARDLVDDTLVARLIDEFTERLNRGETPDIEDYAARFPELAGILREVLPALRLIRLPDLSVAISGTATAAEDHAGTGQPLGDYRIIREVGRGGMGVVYEAEQLSLNRRVALKVLPFAAALDSRQLQRFKNEAHAAAHLHHQNIVPVHGVGCERGVHYYAMQFIEGRTLASLIEELRRLEGREPANGHAHANGKGEPSETCSRHPGQTDGPSALKPTPRSSMPSTEQSSRSREFVRKAANLGLQGAEALEHAHQHGVVHRDIKPANLLVDARGNLWITDFGLAQIQSDTRLTLTGDLVGTLRYMSPEQALARRIVIDHRTDVYSLGATVYELLTLEPAFGGRDRQELLRQIAFEEPRPPGRLNPSIPADLETIVQKAMGKNPDERYATAQELAEDLRRFLEDKPIRARRPTLLQRVRKFARRHQPVVVASALATFLLLLLSMAMVLLNNRQVRNERDQKSAALKLARDRADELDRSLYLQSIALADQKLAAHEPAQVELLLSQCPEALRGCEWNLLKRACHEDPYWDLPTHTAEAEAWCVAFSPDGRRLAAGLANGTVKFWDVATRGPVLTFYGHSHRVTSVAYSPDGATFASGNSDGSIKLWDSKTGNLERSLIGHSAGVHELCFSPDCERLVSASEDQLLKIWDVAAGKELRTLKGHTEVVFDVAYSPDGKRLASASLDGTVKVWDEASGSLQLTFYGHASGALCVRFSRDGRHLFSGGWEMSAKIWDSETGAVERTLSGHTRQVRGVALSPDGRRLASAGSDGTVRLWDASSGHELLALRGHTSMVRRVAFSPDGSLLASASFDGKIKLWNGTPPAVRSRFETLTLRDHTAPVYGVAISPDQTRIAGGSVDRTVNIWDFRTGRLLHTLRGHAGVVTGVAFNHDGRLLATSSRDRTVRVWDATSGAELRVLDASEWMNRVRFSPDGRLIASVGRDWGYRVGIKLWRTADGQDVGTSFLGSEGEIQSLAFSPDGSRLGARLPDSKDRVWDVSTGQVFQTFDGPEKSGASLSFSPDGQWIVSARGGVAAIWDVKSGKSVRDLTIGDPSGTASINTVAFHPDGKRLAAGMRDGSIVMCDARNGRQLRSYRGHSHVVGDLDFSGDGRWLASAGWDNTVRLWNANVTSEEWHGSEARALVEARFDSLLLRDDVLASLRTDKSIAAEIRDLALQLAQKQDEDPYRLDLASWEVINKTGAKAEEYARALRLSEAACRQAPDIGVYVATLGVAQYRTGRYREAAATLARAYDLMTVVPFGSFPSNLSFRAMSEHHLGQRDQARATLERARALMKEPRWSKNEEAIRFMREAESLIGRPPPSTEIPQ